MMDAILADPSEELRFDEIETSIWMCIIDIRDHRQSERDSISNQTLLAQ